MTVSAAVITQRQRASYLLGVIKQLDKKGVKFRSLTEEIDTRTPVGRFFIHFMGAFAQFEHDLIREHTKAGIANARAKGVKFGVVHMLQPDEVPEAWRMVNVEGRLRKDVAEQFGISTQTLARRLREFKLARDGTANHKGGHAFVCNARARMSSTSWLTQKPMDIPGTTLNAKERS